MDAAIPELLTAEEVMRLFKWRSRTTLYENLKAPDFPKPRRLGNSPRWRRDELARYIGEAPEFHGPLEASPAPAKPRPKRDNRDLI